MTLLSVYPQNGHFISLLLPDCAHPAQVAYYLKLCQSYHKIRVLQGDSFSYHEIGSALAVRRQQVIVAEMLPRGAEKLFPGPQRVDRLEKGIG